MDWGRRRRAGGTHANDIRGATRRLALHRSEDTGLFKCSRFFGRRTGCTHPVGRIDAAPIIDAHCSWSGLDRSTLCNAAWAITDVHFSLFVLGMRPALHPF
jgi:hypothetical protein